MKTVNGIIEELTTWILEEKPLPPEKWLESSLMLTLLALPEASKLAQQEQKLAQMETDIISEGKSATEAKIRVKGTPEWLEWSEQNSKLKMIDKLQLLAKKYATVVVSMGG